MNIKKIFDKIPEPQIYEQFGKKHYFDDYKQIWRPVTPEEKIRLKTSVYLEKYLKVPREYIDTEVHLHHYADVDNNGRMDITINYLDAHGKASTLALVECKNESVPLSTQVIEQAVGYADAIECNYFIITNGIEMLQYRYNSENNTYEALSEIVDYNDMKNYYGVIAEWKKTYKRPGINELFDIKKNREAGYQYNFIGEDTPSELIPYIANISDALVDESHTLNNLKSNNFDFIEDMGVSFLNYGDASGGNFGTGEYRSFLINDPEIGRRIISIGILATAKTVNDKVYGNSDGKSVLVVSVRDSAKDEMVVQINLNKFLSVNNHCVYLTHNGAVTRKGAIAEELRQLVYEADASMVCGNKINLGSCCGNLLLYVDTPDFAGMIEKIITYTLIRDKYKKSFSIK